MKQLLTAIATAVVTTLTAGATAQPLPPSEWDDEAKLVLVQAIFGETVSEDVDDDAVAISYVLLRRWRQTRRSLGWTFAEQVRRYCSPVKPYLASEEYRQRLILAGAPAWKVSRVAFRQRLQSAPYDAPEVGYFVGADARRWVRIRSVVEAWGRGELPDACPDAKHWDEPRSVAWVRRPHATCGNTRNVFFR